MESDELAESIAASLSRLRGRGPGRGSGRGHHEHREHHGHHGGPGHRHGFGPGAPGMPGAVDMPWVGGRFGAPAKLRLLEALAAIDEPLTVGELAERIGVDQPRASRLVAQGVELGLVRREADPDDARRTRIALTERGLAFARGARGERREYVRTALDALDESERVEFARLLAKFADAWPTLPDPRVGE